MLLKWVRSIDEKKSYQHNKNMFTGFFSILNVLRIRGLVIIKNFYALRDAYYISNMKFFPINDKILFLYGL